MNIIINNIEATNPDLGVVVVHWSVTKTSGEHTASQYGTESFTPDPAAPGFKPYATLTEADVRGWLTERWGTEGMEAKESALEAQLQAQMAPPVLSGVPWASA